MGNICGQTSSAHLLLFDPVVHLHELLGNLAGLGVVVVVVVVIVVIIQLALVALRRGLLLFLTGHKGL
tara:strand:- start:140 stop:343 length:204 start_codon:yes stop_codon:yes gene_type:complete